MSQWLILHNQSRLSRLLSQVLGDQAICFSLQELVEFTKVHVHIGGRNQHSWKKPGGRSCILGKQIIFQEVFYYINQGLGLYEKEDRAYVCYAWQAYLLSAFHQAKRVINPICPSRLSVSQYHFPRLCELAKSVGLLVPDYEVGMRPDYPCEALDVLWYQPKQSGVNPVLYVASPSTLQKIHFVRYDKGFLTCWPNIEKGVKQKMLQLINRLDIDYGQFFMSDAEVFYGISPIIQPPDPDDEELLEIALCIRDIGYGVDE